jgi:predicted transcriptional regulator
MSAVQFSGGPQQSTVAGGERPSNPTAFLEEPAMRLFKDGYADHNAILKASEAGLADMEAGRFITIATADDRKHLQASLMADVRAGLAARG